MTTRLHGFLLMLLCAGLAACGGGNDGGSARFAGNVGGESGTELAASQVLHLGNGSEPDSLDAQKGRGVPGSNIQRDLYEGLISEAPNGDLIPGGAERWSVSEDGLTYTFELREDARWSNGDPVVADDFVFGLRRGVDPATLSEYSFILAPIRNAAAITAGEMPRESLAARAVDEHTLEIELESPTPYFLGLLTHAVSFPAHRASIERYGDQHTRAGNMVTNGAYMLADWVAQSHVKLVRNPMYWNDEATIVDEVWFYPTENQTSELQRFRAGELDMTYEIPKAQISWIRANLPEQLSIEPYLGSYYYGLNLTKPPFKDNPGLRRALALAVDREIIVEQVNNAGEVAAFGWVPPDTANYEGQVMKEAAWTQPEREAEAKRLYEEAGYSASNPLEVELLYNTEESHRRVAIAVAAMWDQVLGVETSILNQEWKVFLDTRSNFETQVYRSGWIGDYNDAYTFAELFQSGGGLNNTGYSSAEYDRLLGLASKERDPDRRAEYLQQAEAQLLEDMPIVPLYYYVRSRMIAPWVGGYEPNIMDHHYHKNFFVLKH